MTKLITEFPVPHELEKFFVSLIKISGNITLENYVPYPDADRLKRMKEQYNDTLDRMKLE